jgi:hypothetical protein
MATRNERTDKWYSRRPLLRLLLLTLGAGAGSVAAAKGTRSSTDGEAATGLPDAPSNLRDALAAKVDRDALAREASSLLGLRYPEQGSRVRRWAEVASKQVELSGFTGADPGGDSDSYAAMQRALEVAIERRGELIVDGGFRISPRGRGPMEIKHPLTIRGAQHRSSNIPSLADHQAGLYFDADAPCNIIVDDSQLTVDRCAIIGPARSSRNPGIKTMGKNSALRLVGGTVIQSWHIGISYQDGYYHRINDACVVDCLTGIQVSAPSSPSPIYNLVINQLKLTAAAVPNSAAIRIFGTSQVSISQSSFESFLGGGILIEGGTLDLTSSYFEGNGGANVGLSDQARVNLVGNRVYLNTGATPWVSVVDSNVKGAQIVSMANHFIVPEDQTAADIYSLRSDDPLAVSNIGEDIVLNRISMGPSVRYVADSFFGIGRSALRGSHNIRFPAGDPRQHHPISTSPFAKPALRLPPIQAPAGGQIVDDEARAAISALLAALNRQGVIERE